MGLDVDLLELRMTSVYSGNITHNLGAMSEEAGIYSILWRPEEVGVTHAKHLIDPLQAAIIWMKAEPGRFKKHDASNGWGTYEQFIPWLEKYLAACIENPEAEIQVSR